MKIIIVKDYEKVSDKAFEIMKEVVSGNPEAVLGLATGTRSEEHTSELQSQR